jgi:D-alanyl-D-alanine carboxypeptidase
MRAIFVSLLLLLATSVPAFADKVDEYVLWRMAERNVPGAAVAVIQKGRVVKMKGYGLASVEFDVPVSADTVFEIGSVSKQMTAAAIMLLVEDGKVSLDERISAYLPNTPESWKDVTVRHLLTHSSGVKSYTSLEGFELSRRMNVNQFIAKLAPHPLEFTPGERNIYSNSAYNLLALIVESRSGMKYLDFMKKRIFEPLGMTRTTDRDPKIIVKKRVTGYEWEGGRLVGRDGSLTDLTGAGSIVSTIGDMVKWANAVGGSTFLKPASKAEWWKKFVFNDGKESVYGFGWRIGETRGIKTIGHTGQTAGFGAAHFRYPDTDTVVVVLTNIGEIGVGGAMATGVAKLYIPAMSLRAMKPISDSSAARTESFQKALTSRLANSPDETVMSAALVRSVSTARAKEVNTRLARHGAAKRVDLVGKESTDNRDRYLYRVDTGKRVHLWRVAFDAEGKLTEMTLEEEE